MNWCDATYDFLLSQMDDDARIKLGLPSRQRRARGGRAAAAAAAPAPTLPPPAAAAAGNIDTENEDDLPLLPSRNKKRKRTSR